MKIKMENSDNLKSTYDYALAYTTKGFSIISLKPKSKQPSIASGNHLQYPFLQKSN